MGERLTGWGPRLALALLAVLLPTAATGASHDVLAMTAWATAVDELQRGPIEIGAPGSALASYGTAADALGEAEGDQLGVLSLGDGGLVTLAFESGIGDGPGDDFAVFENGFWSEEGLFAELAFVEVSSNGVDFARFDSLCLRTLPVSGGGVVDPGDYANLAGSTEAGIGVGFDLAELAGHPLVVTGLIDLQDVGFVRLVDVIGDGSSLDAFDNPVYDPYPTPFASGGFDVDGVGVIHVPEPDLALALGCGLGGVGALAARRRRRAC